MRHLNRAGLAFARLHSVRGTGRDRAVMQARAIGQARALERLKRLDYPALLQIIEAGGRDADEAELIVLERSRQVELPYGGPVEPTTAEPTKSRD